VGPCTGGFLSNLLAHLATSDPNHRVKYIEEWNEPQGRGYWNGSVAQLSRIMQDIYTSVKASSRSDILVNSVAPSGGPNSVQSYFQLLCAASSQPMQYSDIVDFHSYNFPPNGTPDPGAVTTIAQNVKNVMASCPSGNNKPIWMTEGGWG